MKSCCIFQDHYDVERNTTVFPCFTTQQQICKTKTKTDFLSETSLILRLNVSYHITAHCGVIICPTLTSTLPYLTFVVSDISAESIFMSARPTQPSIRPGSVNEYQL